MGRVPIHLRVSKAQELLGYAPDTLDHGLKVFVDWMNEYDPLSSWGNIF